MLDVPAYLDRIGYSGPTRPSDETLRALHRAHLFTVPFENLDIHIGRKIICDEGRFLDKIVKEGRGGFCYELNGAFAALLRELGFQVSLFAASVFQPDGSSGHDFGHLCLRVDLEHPWLADVGFGESFLEPLRLEPDLEQPQIALVYRLTQGGDLYQMEVKTAGKWEPQYTFTLQPRQLSDFAAMCHYQQTSPDSHFTQNRICSLATPTGRITLSNGRLIETRDGVRQERSVDEAEWRQELGETFGIVLPV